MASWMNCSSLTYACTGQQLLQKGLIISWKYFSCLLCVATILQCTGLCFADPDNGVLHPSLQKHEAQRPVRFLRFIINPPAAAATAPAGATL